LVRFILAGRSSGADGIGPGVENADLFAFAAEVDRENCLAAQFVSSD
jgi:hypothetical protein